MNPAVIIAGIDGLIALLDHLAAKGEVSPEKVADIRARAKASEDRWDAAVEAAKFKAGDGE